MFLCFSELYIWGVEVLFLYNQIRDVMVSILASSVVDRGFGSNQRLQNWFLLLLAKEKKQRLVGSESG